MNAPLALPEKRPNGCPPGQGTHPGAWSGRIGNPPHVPTEQSRALVKRLCQTLPRRMIAEVLQIAESTLYLHYKAELAEGKAKLVEELGKSVINKARNGDNDMLKFYLKSHGGWDETQRHEHTGANGGPIQHVDVAQLAAIFAGLNDEQLGLIEPILAAIASSGDHGQSPGGGGSAAPGQGGAAAPPA